MPTAPKKTAKQSMLDDAKGHLDWAQATLGDALTPADSVQPMLTTRIALAHALIDLARETSN